jgi:membrane-associated phospholipid phosphatase
VTAWLKALTEFGDIALLMPLGAVILLWLLLIRCARGAAWWAIAGAFCTGLTALLKISFYECPPTPDLHSPSGHTSLSTLVYGTLTLVTATEGRGALWRITTIGGGGGFVLGIAASRLLLYVHSAAEVGLGLVIGTVALALFGRGYLRYRTGEVWLSPLFVMGGALVVILHGRQFAAEQFLRAIARYLRLHCA